MNEEIDELAFQAGCTKHSYHDPAHPDLDGFIIHQTVLDKFAESIVRKCMELGDKALQDGKWPGDVIATHFGVNK